MTAGRSGSRRLLPPLHRSLMTTMKIESTIPCRQIRETPPTQLTFSEVLPTEAPTSARGLSTHYHLRLPRATLPAFRTNRFIARTRLIVTTKVRKLNSVSVWDTSKGFADFRRLFVTERNQGTRDQRAAAAVTAQEKSTSLSLPLSSMRQHFSFCFRQFCRYCVHVATFFGYRFYSIRSALRTTALENADDTFCERISYDVGYSDHE